MSSRKFKFISPGVFINEIDRSQINQLPNAVGPLIVGRFEKGPALVPVQVNSFEDFVLTFGNPIAGGGSQDLFREGNFSAPTYGAYAVQAYLRNNSPVTVVRLLGDTNKDADGTADSLAGWRTDKTDIGESITLDNQGGAFGLFVAQHPALNTYTVDFNIDTDSERQISASFSGSLEGAGAGNFLLTASSDTGAESSFVAATGIGGFGTGSSDSQTAANFASAINAAAATDGYGGFSAAVTDSTNGIVTVTLTSVYSNFKVDDGRRAAAVDKLDTNGVSDLDEFTFNVATAGGGSNTTVRVIVKAALNDPTGDIIHVAKGADDNATADNIIAAIVGTSDQTKARYGTSNAGDSTNGVAGLTAKEGSGTKKITLESTTIDETGTSITITNVQGLINDSGVSFSLTPFVAQITGSTANDTQNTTVDTDTLAYATGSAFAATGTLAAVWYVNEGSVELDGNSLATGSDALTGSGIFLRPTENGTFKAIVKDNDGTTVARTSFNFTETSARFIRKRFNTNPTLTNSDITSNPTSYWLGETYEGSVKDKLDVLNFDKDTSFGSIVPLTSPDGSTYAGGNFKKTFTTMDAGQGVVGKTGYFIAQDTNSDYANFNPASMEKLFRFVGRLTREDVQQNVKISIQDIRVSDDPNNDYGSFTVAIRDIRDTDDNPIYLEQYNNCNLNPASDNFISKKIGDKYERWDYDNNLYKEYGDYTNISKYVRVEVTDKLRDNQLEASLLPFGFFGPPVFNEFTVDRTGDAFKATDGYILLSTSTSGTMVYADTNYTGSFELNDGAPFSQTGAFGPEAGVSDTFTGSIRLSFPELRLRVSSSEGFLQDPTDAFFGVDTTYESNTFDKSVLDVIRAKPAAINSHIADTDQKDTSNSFVFTLDNIRNVAATDEGFTGAYKVGAVYDENARKEKTAYNVLSGASGTGAKASPSYENILDAGYDRFTTVLHGAFDAVDITEREPFRNTFLDGGKATTNYAFNSIEVGIDSLRDPERVEYNMIAFPGLTNNSLNRKLVRNTEARGDALAIIDAAGGYVPDTENTLSAENRLGTVTDTVNTVKNSLRLNSSYGATYYPWVQIRDTINGVNVWAPPSVAAIGALGYSESVSELWFAPAGFTRGGLSANSAAGLPVVGVRQRLTSKDRDKLYESNINPIASFPAEGIVIFGQKTLQITPSALDRINVRRLAIFLKREISRISATLLFDQNVQTTWSRFKGQAETLLSGVKAGLGLSDYRVVLDESTTTPDLIDRNILYAKIFVKPARAIEFIAIDFVITDSGASFDD